MPISLQTIGRFLNTVQAGLLRERHHRPAHQLHYIEWALGAVAAQLQMFNQQIKKTVGL